MLPVGINAMMEGAGTGVADVVSQVMTTVTSITANPLVAIAVALPVTGGIIALAKKLFHR